MMQLNSMFIDFSLENNNDNDNNNNHKTLVDEENKLTLLRVSSSLISPRSHDTKFNTRETFNCLNKKRPFLLLWKSKAMKTIESKEVTQCKDKKAP